MKKTLLSLLLFFITHSAFSDCTESYSRALGFNSFSLGVIAPITATLGTIFIKGKIDHNINNDDALASGGFAIAGGAVAAFNIAELSSGYQKVLRLTKLLKNTELSARKQKLLDYRLSLLTQDVQAEVLKMIPVEKQYSEEEIQNMISESEVSQIFLQGFEREFCANESSLYGYRKIIHWIAGHLYVNL